MDGKTNFLLTLLSDWIQFDSETNRITCTIAGKNKETNCIQGTSAVSIHDEILKCHATSTGHVAGHECKIVLRNKLQANLIAAVQKLSVKQEQDFCTIFDTSHTFCKRERERERGPSLINQSS